MLSKLFHRNTNENRLLRLMLVFALIFAAAHVALHDLDVGGVSLNGHSECQVCRLNHMPAVSFDEHVLFTPLQLLADFLPVAEKLYLYSHFFSLRWARAPPLF